MKRRVLGIGCCLAMLLLLIDGQTAQAGVRQGLELCLRSVLPALLPFFFLSKVLIAALWGKSPTILRLIGTLFRMPEGGESLLIPALLGGFPAGAAAVGEAWQSGGLEKDTAERLLGWCGNVGPAFLFGIAAGTLPGRWSGWYLWGLLLLGALTAAWIIPGKIAAATPKAAEKSTDIMGQTVLTMGKICITVVLFRVITRYMDVYLSLDGTPKVLLEGILEMTNGCCDLSLVPIRYRMIAAGILMSLGGVCVLFQTRAVTQGLCLKWYFIGKGIQALVCLLGTCRPQMLLFLIAFLSFAKIWVAFFKKPLYNKEKLRFRRKLCFSERK